MTQGQIPPSETPLALIGRHRLIPLLALQKVEDGVPLAQSLVDAGLPVMEIALRSTAAPQAIAAIRRSVPQAIVAAGRIGPGLAKGRALYVPNTAFNSNMHH